MTITKAQRLMLKKRLKELEEQRKWFPIFIIPALFIMYVYGVIFGIILALILGIQRNNMEKEINDIKFKLANKS